MRELFLIMLLTSSALMMGCGAAAEHDDAGTAAESTATEATEATEKPSTIVRESFEEGDTQALELATEEVEE